MTFLDIFKTMKNNYPVFYDAFRNFTWLFFEDVREYGYVSLLKLSLSPDLRAIGFFQYYSEDDCDMVASMSFFDLNFIVKNDDFFAKGDMSAVEFYHLLLRLLNTEVL